MNIRHLLLAMLFLYGYGIQAQTCNYLAYESFTYTSGVALNGLQGGSGWQAPWTVQNDNATLPGYQTNSGTAMAYADLQTVGIYGSGGYVYLTSGRRLNTATSGPFAAYLTGSGTIGQPGTTLWASVLLRKTNNNDEEVGFYLHSDNIAWCNNCTTNKVAVGYFGSASNVSGQRRWSLRIGNNVYPSDVPMVANETAFLALQITFQSGQTVVDLFANPTTLGNTTPTPNLSQTTTSPLEFRSIAAYMGNNSGTGHMDEIRLGTSYACVAPDATVMVNQAPVAAFTFAPGTGNAPLTVNFDASTAYDPDGTIASYSWNFGDGTAAGSGLTTSHVYTAIGILPITLTVTDNLGIQHSFTQSITVLDANGTFPCLLRLYNEQLASCTLNNGRFRLENAQNVSHTLFNSMGGTVAPTGSNIYGNLAPGNYTLTASAVNGCRDTFALTVAVDSSTCSGWAPNPCAMKIGTGLEGLAYYSSTRMFKDYFKTAGQWITYDPNGGAWDSNDLQHMPADTNGYATVVPFPTPNGNRAIRGIISANGYMPVNEPLRLLYDGQGTIQMQGGVTVSSSTPGQIDFTINNTGNIWFHITQSTQGNHVRNIRIVAISDLATYQTEPYRQNFLDKCDQFESLRFMDLMHTNGSGQVQWANRTKPTYYSQAVAPNGGMAYEYIIELANTLQKDIWLCVPHQADNNYITQMATLFRDQLDPGINVYLEYSNEVWNWIFSQTHWVDQNGPSNLSYPRKYVLRAQNAFDIWHNVWGTQKTRVRRVLGTQMGYDWVTQEILGHADQDKYDYISPSWYVGLDHDNTGVPNLQALGASATVADVMQNANNVFTSFYPRWRMVYDIAKLMGKKVVNYEGGQHFTNFTVPPYIQSMYDAQVDPAMYLLYDRMLDSLRVLGSEMPFAFTMCGPWQSIYGSWGHLFDVDDPAPWTDRPKHQVLLDNIALCTTSTPLPAEILYFGAQAKDQAIAVDWTVATERDLVEYVLERSDDGVAFSPIHTQSARVAGGEQRYRFLDKNAVPGVVYYYRLQMLDKDGSVTYSYIRTAQITDANPVQLFPNPVHDQLTIHWNGYQAAFAEVLDITGKPIMTVQGQATTVPTGHLPNGIYSLRIQGEGRNATYLRFVVAH